MIDADITKRKFKDIFLIGYHVLQHVPEDMKAMKEHCGAMKSDAWPILQVRLDYSREYADEDFEAERIGNRTDHVKTLASSEEFYQKFSDEDCFKYGF